MNIAPAGINPPLRIVHDEPMSLDEFWRFSAENPELRLEREPNGDVVLTSPTPGGAGIRSSSILGQLYMWSEKDGSGYALDSSTGCQLPDGSVRSAYAAWISSQRWTPPPVQDDAPYLSPTS
jgi:Uma2 family endonuclease